MAITLKSRKQPKHHHTEADIQNRLYWWCYKKSHDSIAPNVYLYDWESDLFSVTHAGYAHEYEIKISRSDFKADADKYDKHAILTQGSKALSEHQQRQYERYKDKKPGGHWTDWLAKLTPDLRIPCHRPNYFWYVCPWEVIPVDLVPAHAGLIWLHDHGYFEVQKDAPKLHREPVADALIRKVDISCRYKYWRQRLAPN